MPKIIIKKAYHNKKLSVVALRTQEEFFLDDNHLPEGVNGLIKVEEMPGGKTSKSHIKIVAKQDILLVVWGIHDSGSGAKSICFIRADLKDRGTGSPRFAKPMIWAKLRLALKKSGKPKVHASGGLENALVYKHERAISDFCNEGAHGWIIPRGKIDGLLRSLNT